MKTRTEFQTEKKRLKVPKVEEFTISFTDGVSERLKVRVDQCGSRAIKNDLNRRLVLCFTDEIFPTFSDITHLM